MGAQRAARATGQKAQPPPFLVPLQDVAPGTAVPGNAQAVPASQATAAEEPLDAWTRRVSGKTDVPARALRAYATADLAMRSQAPACRLSWATLAGIGRVESHHGLINGSRLGADGRAAKPIIGVPLDGSPGVKAIKDTDGGRFDGDVTWDRAVGPMQFIPGTWLRYAARASGDGNPPDPQNVDDAALAAARYLCADGARPRHRQWLVGRRNVVQQLRQVRTAGVQRRGRLRPREPDLRLTITLDGDAGTDLTERLLVLRRRIHRGGHP